MMKPTGKNMVADERGTVATIMLFPVFAVCALLLVQGVFWQQDRTVAEAAADRASSAVALYGASFGDAEAAAISRMQAAGMIDVSVTISRDSNLTVVVVSALSHGLLPFTSQPISARSVAPTEGFQAP